MSKSREVDVVWAFGTAAGVSNRLGSTGAVATPYNTFGYGEQYTFTIETDGAATCSYQIRVSRTSSGPWLAMSSGTLATGATDVVQLPGPFKFLSPRVKTLNSTANGVVIRATAV